MENPITLTVDGQNTKKRLDLFLHRNFPEFSRSFFAKHITNASITVNQKHKKPSYLLKEGDSVFIPPSILIPHSSSLIPNFLLQIPILFEDESLLVINKPAGIQVHPGSTEKEKTVVNWLIAKYPEVRNVGEDPLRPGIVHRLDKDTSGVLVVAKTQESFYELKKLFATRKIKKTYLAIVYGVPSPQSGTIDKPIARSASFRRQVIPEGKTKYKGTPRTATTNYIVLQQFPKHALLEVHPKTGRMHQIRIHLSSFGHPIVGDKLYSRKEFRDFPSAPRHLLHAQKITFTLFKKEYVFSSVIPDDFNDFSSTSNTSSLFPR